MSFTYNSNGFSIAAFGVLALAVFGASLIVPLSSYGQFPASQDSPVLKIPKSVWRYRWGDSPVDAKGAPLWTYQDASSPEWKPMGKGQSFK